MKPVVIIAIAVGCSIAGTLGVLITWQGVATMQAQEISNDIDLANSYRNQYYEITSDFCINEPPSISYEGIKIGFEKYKRVQQDIAKMQPTLDDLKNKMSILSEKYPNNEYLILEDATCPYEREWWNWVSAFVTSRPIEGNEVVEPLNNADQEPLEWCDDDGNCYRFSNP